jgi:GT2 family glycosyltransferase
VVHVPAMTPLPFPDGVEVVIVAHNNLAALPGVMTALMDTGCPARDITLVDVASTDGTGDWLAANYPDVRHRLLARNDGPGPGRNIGIMEATRPFVLLMDGDVLIEPETVQRLHAAMVADRRIRIGSPIVVHAGRPDTIQYAGGAIHFICEAINPWLDRTLAERGAAPADIDAAPTCALLLDRATAIEVGLFDERYFIGKEDGDFTHRFRIAGHIIRELPDARVRHHSRPRGTWLFYYQIRNRWHFMLKNYQWRTLVFILPCLLVHEPVQFAVLVAKGHGTTYFKAVKGLIEMLPALGGDRALVRRIRRANDAVLLHSGRLIVRDDLASNALVRFGKNAYEGFLSGYWRLLRATVLRG